MKNAGEACYQCTERRQGCHSDCEKYKKCLDEYYEEKRAYQEAKRKDSEVTGFLKKSKARMTGHKRT